MSNPTTADYIQRLLATAPALDDETRAKLVAIFAGESDE